MVKKFCDICEREITDLSQLPTRDIFVDHEHYKMFVCNRCYKKMIRIIKKSTAKERRAEMRAIKYNERSSMEG